MPMPREDDNTLDNFRLYEDKESTSEAQDIERDHKDLGGESSNTGSRAIARHTPQDGLLESESSSSLREVRFSEQEFPAGTLVSNIKYDHLESQNDNLFYLFHNWLDYALAHYFAEFKTIKDNMVKVLFNPLMALLTEKLSYWNDDKWIEKLSEILWDIPNNKWIEHKFELQSSMVEMAKREIAIYLQNFVGCLKFLMRHPSFWHNQTFEPFYVYNKNEE